MTKLDSLLQGIVADPQAEDRWLVLADWLEEHDDPRRAELTRLHRKLLAWLRPALTIDAVRHWFAAAWRLKIAAGEEVKAATDARTRAAAMTLAIVWSDSTVLKLATAIYNERRFQDMPVLGDALVDAGCDNEVILGHCRGPGPHVKGCFVVDLLLGKS